jgi:hypothetical protein
MLVGGHRGQREHLRGGGLLEVDDQPHDARLVLPHAHAGDVRVVGLDLAHDLAQRRAQLEAVDVDPRRDGAAAMKCLADSAASDSMVTRV